MEQTWISTGEAIRLLGFYLSGKTFREKYKPLLPWVLTPGGHYRWLRSAVNEAKTAMGG